MAGHHIRQEIPIWQRGTMLENKRIREYMFENTILSDSFKTEIDEDVEE